MIPRLLVPVGARPPAGEAAATQRRRPTTMDERTLIPAMLPIVHLNGQSTIPSNLPLESIAARVVVPRDVSREAYAVQEDSSTPLQPTDLDERITVPVGAVPPTVIEPMTLPPPEDLVEPDIFMTGEVHLAPPEQKKEEKAKWQVITRASSFAFHALLLALILLQAKLFPPHEPTQAEVDLARRQLTYILPPGAFEPPKPSTRPPAPKVHVDPNVLKKIAPPIEPAPAPVPQPERPIKELPSAPIPKPNAAPPEVQPSDTTPKVDAPKAPLKLEAPDTPQPKHGLILPKGLSSRQSIDDTVRASPRVSAPRAIVGGGRVSGGSRGGGGGSGGTAYGGLEMLTPDQGVDFRDYLQRVHDVIERNWFAVMPASVELGDRGMVILTFRINRDGSVPSDDPTINRNSGKEPLDRAAFSSIRASNPFDRLPPQFNGPYIELRCTYLYNIPLEEYYRQ